MKGSSKISKRNYYSGNNIIRCGPSPTRLIKEHYRDLKIKREKLLKKEHPSLYRIIKIQEKIYYTLVISNFYFKIYFMILLLPINNIEILLNKIISIIRRKSFLGYQKIASKVRVYIKKVALWLYTKLYLTISLKKRLFQTLYKRLFHSFKGISKEPQKFDNTFGPPIDNTYGKSNYGSKSSFDFHSIYFIRKVKNIEENKLQTQITIDIEKTLKVNKYDYYLILENLKSVYNEFLIIGEKGFVNNCNMNGYIIFQEFIQKIGFDENINTTNANQTEIHPNHICKSTKWIFNLVILNLYHLSLFIIKRIEEEQLEDLIENNEDLLCDYYNFNKHIYSLISTSIRNKIIKRSLKYFKNIYTAFDTEYKNINFKENRLLSAQLALNTKAIIKIPINKSYVLSEVNTDTNDKYLINHSSRSLSFSSIEASINESILNIRSLKFKNHDSILNNIINILKNKVEENILEVFEKEDHIVFSFPRTKTVTYIYLNSYGKGISFEELVKISNTLAKPYLDNELNKIVRILEKAKEGINFNVVKEKSDEMSELIISEDVKEDIKTLFDKKTKRIDLFEEEKIKISLTSTRNNFFFAHLTNADLCMMNDFESLKESLDIVQKYFVTLKKPLDIDDTNVFIRDTMLLAPAGKRSLNALGSLYNLSKIELEKHDISNMDILLKKDQKKFIEYAVNDALICLKHANFMEDFMFKMKEMGIPLTLSGLGQKFVKSIWSESGYKGYQLNPVYLLGDSSKTLTPKGLFNTCQHNNVPMFLSYYIANYKGGRNESYMYGVDNKTRWFDYDLTSAYTTVMAFLGDPDYSKAEEQTKSWLDNVSQKELLNSYTIISIKEFHFEGTKYPSIPCYVDETTTAYPLNGKAILTGPEYLIAKSQGCVFSIDKIFWIPWKTKTTLLEDESEYKENKALVNNDPRIIEVGMKTTKNKSTEYTKTELTQMPFLDTLDKVQSMRRKHRKGTIENLLYKEMGNSMYGSVVRGINEKMKFDIKTQGTKRMECIPLSNPILASYITAYIRSIIGECLHLTSKLEGAKIVSATTDGFITNIEGLENKIIEKSILLKQFSHMRRILSDNPQSLELKKDDGGVGVISWTTRGQLSSNANIKATTGFQSGNYTLRNLETLFKETLATKQKSLEFISSRLRSAKDLYLHGGHVTRVFKDQVFRLKYDNRRIVKREAENLNITENLLDTSPVENCVQCKNLRYLAKFAETKIYNKMSHTPSTSVFYKKNVDLAILNFIKILIHCPEKYGIENPFYTYKDIIEFISKFDGKTKLSPDSISKLKNRRLAWKNVPKNEDTLLFIEFVKTKHKFRLFRDELFFHQE